jgi:hypothetical protein
MALSVFTEICKPKQDFEHQVHGAFQCSGTVYQVLTCWTCPFFNFGFGNPGYIHDSTPDLALKKKKRISSQIDIQFSKT